MTIKLTKPTAIDCFCGAGGLALGFKMAGFDIKYAFDIDEAAIRTYRLNLGSHAEIADATTLSKRAIEEAIGEEIESIDVVMGGPPCQGFSVQRRGDDNDPRNDLVLDFMRLVIEIRPRFFLMENVAGLLSVRGRPVLNRLMEQCRSAGYVPQIRKLNAYDFGVPQVRRRVFIVGELTDSALMKFSFPEPTRKDGNFPATVREAIGDLINRAENELPNHRADRLSPRNLERIRAVREGQGRESLPVHLQLETHTRNISHRHLDVYGRMAWDQPSPTITARFDSFSRGRFGHPSLDRTITLREGARLQSFLDDFEFSGSKVEVARQIGNAVPPLLAQAIANRIKSCLSGGR